MTALAPAAPFSQTGVRHLHRSPLEDQLRQSGVRLLAGVDEAGRGPLAGPVVAAAVIAPSDCDLPEVDDSKRLTAAQRERVHGILTDRCETAVAVVEASVIDELNILRATHLAMRRAVNGLPRRPDHVLIDGLAIGEADFPYTAVVGGDARCWCIAAASVIAKVTRDRIMVGLDERFPGYGFARHKGYPTAQHLRCLRALGPSPVHRRSFAPVRALLEPQLPLD